MLRPEVSPGQVRGRPRCLRDAGDEDPSRFRGKKLPVVVLKSQKRLAYFLTVPWGDPRGRHQAQPPHHTRSASGTSSSDRNATAPAASPSACRDSRWSAIQVLSIQGRCRDGRPGRETSELLAIRRGLPLRELDQARDVCLHPGFAVADRRTPPRSVRSRSRTVITGGESRRHRLDSAARGWGDVIGCGPSDRDRLLMSQRARGGGDGRPRAKGPAPGWPFGGA